jgi:hypothetical protein
MHHHNRTPHDETTKPHLASTRSKRSGRKISDWQANTRRGLQGDRDRAGTQD